jgi:hypothetical protein
MESNKVCLVLGIMWQMKVASHVVKEDDDKMRIGVLEGAWREVGAS